MDSSIQKKKRERNRMREKKETKNGWDNKKQLAR